MINKSLSLIPLPGLILAMLAPALAADSIKINVRVMAGRIPAAQREATVKAVRAFYDFWNTGDETLLKQAIAENFTDRTLPPGRPQGPEGPAFCLAPVPRCRARPQGDGGKDDSRRQLRHRTHELHRTFHRGLRWDARQWTVNRLHRYRSRQGR